MQSYCQPVRCVLTQDRERDMFIHKSYFNFRFSNQQTFLLAKAGKVPTLGTHHKNGMNTSNICTAATNKISCRHPHKRCITILINIEKQQKTHIKATRTRGHPACPALLLCNDLASAKNLSQSTLSLHLRHCLLFIISDHHD